MRIWGRFDLYVIFPIFDCFHPLSIFFVGFACPVRVEKHMVAILTFLSFHRYLFYGEIPPKTQRKYLMSTQKKYIY